MPRPHEDLERHTLVDHRPGGKALGFALDRWFAIEIAQVKRARVDAAVSAYESMIESAHPAAGGARDGVVFSAATDREVVVLCGVAGHEDFRHVSRAWDDRHRVADGHAVTESRTLRLYRVAETAGASEIDPASHDAYVVERTPAERRPAGSVAHHISAADGFRGMVVFRSDDGHRSFALYRFERLAQFAAARDATAPHAEHLLPRKTFSADERV